MEQGHIGPRGLGNCRAFKLRLVPSGETRFGSDSRQCRTVDDIHPALPMHNKEYTIIPIV